MSPYGLKGLGYTKEDILSECIRTIDKGMVNKAYAVLVIIILTPIIKRICLNLLYQSNLTPELRSYTIIEDFLNNLWIIDYAVIVAYLSWIILLSSAW